MKRIELVKGMVMIMMVTLLAVTACAKSDRDKKQGPPPEAITACEGKQDGDTVSFKGREGEPLSATCQSINGQLVAVPEGHKRRQ